MTIYTKIQISGVTLNDVISSKVSKVVGKNNSSSKFSAKINNYAGTHSGTWVIGNEVDIYADKDINPPTTKIFTGILENINYPSQGLNETIQLSGRDYTARLMDRTVEPEVYTNLPAGSIVKDIINKYTDDITINNVDNTSTTIKRIAFNHTPVFDAIKKLAELSSYTFYVDTDKDLHFEQPSTVSSGKTFDSTNVLRANVKERRDTVFNEIWVYGDRYLDSVKEEFTADGVGSVFTLTYKPHNTQVDIGSPITSATRQKGAIAQMNIVPSSGVNYLVDFEDRQIIFVSGTDLGYSAIPSSGELVTIDYKRSLPIIKVGKDNNSIAKYGKRVMKIIDKEIKDPDSAQERLLQELADNINPKKEATIDVKGIVDVTPSQTAVVNLPHQGVFNKTYEILEANYDFNKQNNLTDSVLKLKLNKKIDDVTDTIKDLINQVRTIQAQDIDSSDILSRYEYTTGSVTIRQSGCIVYQKSIAGDTLIWKNANFGIWNTGKWGNAANVSFVLGNTQAAVLGTSKLGAQSSSWTKVWSGCYP